ncbi:MAG TPA: PhzF family phenazine biosynthesis protein [Ktedonobacterales bacterium]|jgi:trans-2,3-dihydro-3-hydroxyanthranilate isomerase
MRRLPFVQLDVFTSKPFGGNQLAVFEDAQSLSDAEMQSIAREMNYSESTFILPATDPKALCRVRIFTPATELPFAGHPVVGTTWALAYLGSIPGGGSPVYLELGVGTLPVEVLYEERKPSFVWMHQPVPKFESWAGDRNALASALGLAPDAFDGDLPIEHGTAGGGGFIYVPLKSLEAVGKARPGPGLAAAMATTTANVGVFVFTLEKPATGADVHGRMFGAAMGIVEDAATGSAAGPLGAYLLRHGKSRPDGERETRIRLEQGVEMGRPSRIEIAITGTAEQIEDVRVGGESVVTAEGEFYLPDAEK